MEGHIQHGRSASQPDAVSHSSATKKERGPHIYKMKDLCEKAGVSRQVVHFYIQQGLLPEGKKTGKNMAYYTEEHVERLLLVRKLQHEHFLPLKAIVALLEERDEAFSPAQQKHMREVRAAMPEPFTRVADCQMVDAYALSERLGLARDDVDEIIKEGLIAAAERRDPETGALRLLIFGDDVWRLEIYAELRKAGFTRELGFETRDLAMYDEAVERLIVKEARVIADRLGEVAPRDAASLLAKAIPIVGNLLARLHAEKAKSLFATL